MNMKQDESWDITQHTPMPRSKDDDGYFEQMSRAVFLAGLNWKVIEKKWPDIKCLFANFPIDEVAQFDDMDIDRLLKDEGGVWQGFLPGTAIWNHFTIIPLDTIYCRY